VECGRRVTVARSITVTLMVHLARYPLQRPTCSAIFFLIPLPFYRFRYMWTPTSHALRLCSLGSQQVSMRRRPLRFTGRPSSRRGVAPASLNPGVILDLFALLRDFSLGEKRECNAGPGSGRGPTESQELLCRALQDAIDEVMEKFAEAQCEYHAVTANSRDWHKWKGEMIAYANVVALLEDLKSRAVLVG
jgi:hypothetical protein